MGTEEMSTRIDAKAGFNQSHNEGSVLNEGQQKVTRFVFSSHIGVCHIN